MDEKQKRLGYGEKKRGDTRNDIGLKNNEGRIEENVGCNEEGDR